MNPTGPQLERTLERITTHLRAHVAELRRLEQGDTPRRELEQRRELIARLQGHRADLIRTALAPPRTIRAGHLHGQAADRPRPKTAFSAPAVRRGSRGKPDARFRPGSTGAPGRSGPSVEDGLRRGGVEEVEMGRIDSEAHAAPGGDLRARLDARHAVTAARDGSLA